MAMAKLCAARRVKDQNITTLTLATHNSHHSLPIRGAQLAYIVQLCCVHRAITFEGESVCLGHDTILIEVAGGGIVASHAVLPNSHLQSLGGLVFLDADCGDMTLFRWIRAPFVQSTPVRNCETKQ